MMLVGLIQRAEGSKRLKRKPPKREEFDPRLPSNSRLQLLLPVLLPCQPALQNSDWSALQPCDQIPQHFRWRERVRDREGGQGKKAGPDKYSFWYQKWDTTIPSTSKCGSEFGPMWIAWETNKGFENFTETLPACTEGTEVGRNEGRQEGWLTHGIAQV